MLLGLWQASWDGEASCELASDKNLGMGQRVPVGMGVVVPASRIAETLNQSELVKQRQEEYERRTENAATMDSLFPKDNPRHGDL